jgi:hypothetical protein
MMGQFIVSNTLGTNENVQVAFSLYPNPANRKIIYKTREHIEMKFII